MTQSSAKAEKFATQDNVLPMDETNLLGVFGTDDDLKALIRYPSGEIQRVAQGDMTRLGQVAAIKLGAVYLTNAGRERVLRMPETVHEDDQLLGA